MKHAENHSTENQSFCSVQSPTRYPQPRKFFVPPGANASASLPRIFLRASLPRAASLTSCRRQHHFCILQLILCSSNPEPRSLFLQHATHNLELVFKQKGESKRLSSCITSGRYLLSHAVAHILPSARDGLTAGFGMEPGVSRPGIFTQNICSLKST